MKQRIPRSWQFGFISALAIAVAIIVTLQSPSTYAATDAAARVVKYSKEDIIPVRAKLRFSTLIILPEDEEILDFTTGDKEFWVINGAHNLCYVHPAQAGIRSNLNLITASGRVYSFLLTEVSNQPNAEPDLKIFVEPKETSGTLGAGLRGYVHAGEFEAYKKELETLRSETAEQVRAAQAQAAEQVNRDRHPDRDVGDRDIEAREVGRGPRRSVASLHPGDRSPAAQRGASALSRRSRVSSRGCGGRDRRPRPARMPSGSVRRWVG